MSSRGLYILYLDNPKSKISRRQRCLWMMVLLLLLIVDAVSVLYTARSLQAYKGHGLTKFMLNTYASILKLMLIKNKFLGTSDLTVPDLCGIIGKVFLITSVQCTYLLSVLENCCVILDNPSWGSKLQCAYLVSAYFVITLVILCC